MSKFTHQMQHVSPVTVCNVGCTYFAQACDVLMEILVIAAVVIPFSALVMNAFAGEDDFDFL